MKSLNFVVVDDATFMRTLLKNMIEEDKNNTVVGQGCNGIEAIKQAELHQPDVMTLDITMPDMDGLTAVKEVLRVSPHTKIIMVSAMGQQSLVIEAIKEGAGDFVIKPFEKSRVMQAIKNVTAT